MRDALADFLCEEALFAAGFLADFFPIGALRVLVFLVDFRADAFFARGFLFAGFFFAEAFFAEVFFA